ncbi:MAG: diaminopimelate epimerase [Armatimonadaceae bacterium]
MMNLPFTKMQGIGNDFVIVDCLAADAPSPDFIQRVSVHLCDRKFGIGSDGVILILPPASGSGNDFTMRMFNPDGSESEMCGNGIRCFARFVQDQGYTDKPVVRVDTLAGVKALELVGTDSVKVDMGKPGLDRADLPMLGESGTALGQEVDVNGETVAITGVSMGNPHAVFFVDDATDALINRLGPPLEVHPLFPRRTNVHAVQVLGRDEIKMLTWERGAGRTLACGTGACACAVAAHLNGYTERRVLVHLAGGDLRIEWEPDGPVYMTGPATTVFSGTISLD